MKNFSCIRGTGKKGSFYVTALRDGKLCLEVGDLNLERWFLYRRSSTPRRFEWHLNEFSSMRTFWNKWVTTCQKRNGVTFGQAVWYLLEIFVCIYAKNFTENRCGVSDNQLVLSFHKDIILSARIFIHFHLVIDYRVYSIFHKQDELVILKETTSFLLFFVLRMLYFVKMSM